MKNYSVQHFNFKVEKSDRERLDAVSNRLSLSRSEIARRSLRLGLTQLEQVFIPGGAGRKNEARSE